MGVASTALIAELEDAVQGGSSERRVRMLRQVTDLFLSGADRLNEKQIGVFDDVLVCLIERVEARTLAQLSVKLSDTGCAPKEAVRQLAFHPEAAVAVPVLTKSNRLSEADLIEIAGTRGHQHLLAISGRPNLAAPLTDVLLKRGDSSVSLALAKNSGARFSDAGYSSLLERAERDDTLAEKLGLRRDIPANLLRELVSKATAAVRDRLLKAAAPEMREKVQQAIRLVTEQVCVEPVDYSEAETKVLALNRAGKLGDQTINRFAIQEEHANIVAALSLLSTATIEAVEPLLRNPRPDGLIVACKAARLNWSTTTMILRCRPGCRPLSKAEMAEAREVFETLSLSAAQRTIRFWSERRSPMKADVAETAGAVPGISS